MIVFKNVTKIYNNVVALDNISFEIQSGEFVIIIGRTGAGKTTILKLIRREEEPSQGKVFYKNKNILEIPKRRLGELRRRITSIFQDFKLLNSRTVFENIALPLEILGKSKKEIEKKVIEVAERLSIKKNLDQIVWTLSGGEKQKVCLARCLVGNPEVILADEPTGNLDPISAFEIVEILKNLNKNDGITIILATHNKDIVENLKTRTLTLKEGKLVKDEGIGSYALM